MREKDASPNSLKLLERGSRAYNLASDLLPGHPGLFGLSPFADTFPAPSLSSGAPTQSLRVIPGGRRRESITTRSSRSSRPRAARPLCPIPSHATQPHAGAASAGNRAREGPAGVCPPRPMARLSPSLLCRKEGTGGKGSRPAHCPERSEPERSLRLPRLRNRRARTPR